MLEINVGRRLLMKIHPFRLLSIWLLTILIAIMLTSLIVNANKKEVIVKEVEYIVMTQEEYEGSVEDEVIQDDEIGPTMKSLGEYEVTAYCACELCCGEWADSMTFTGEIATEGVTIATYPDDIALGSKVYIEGIGERVAQDIGGAISNKRIDLFFDSHSDALNFGRQTLEVWGVAD